MKKLILGIALFVVVSGGAGAEGFFNATELWGSVSFGGLLSGYQLDLPKQSLLPAPEGCSAFLPMVGVRTYLVGPVGIEAFVGFAGMTTASFSGGYASVQMYDYTTLNVGLVLRDAFRLAGSRTGCAIFVGAGANYSFLSLDNAYTSLFSGVTFQNVISDLGWYSKVGIAWYPTPRFFVDATLLYYYINSHFQQSSVQLDGSYLLGALSLGLAF